MNLRPGMRVLDVGCGVGGPAREIAQFTDCQIIGLNNNDFQIQRARKYTQKAGLENQVSFVKGDFMKLSEQFGEGYFDAGMFELVEITVVLILFIYQFTPSKLRCMLPPGRVCTEKFSRFSSLEEP